MLRTVEFGDTSTGMENGFGLDFSKFMEDYRLQYIRSDEHFFMYTCTLA